MWEVPLETQKSEDVRDTIMAQTLKTITITVPSCRTFQPNNSKPTQGNKKGFLKTWQRFKEKSSKSILKNQVTQKWDTCT